MWYLPSAGTNFIEHGIECHRVRYLFKKSVIGNGRQNTTTQHLIYTGDQLDQAVKGRYVPDALKTLSA